VGAGGLRKLSAAADVFVQTRVPAATTSIGSSFLPDHDEVAASRALSGSGPGCSCAMCLRQAASETVKMPAMPPGLGGWLRDMGAKLHEPYVAVVEETAAEVEEVWVDVEEPDEAGSGSGAIPFEEQLRQAQGLTESESGTGHVGEAPPPGMGMPGDIVSDTPWGSHGFEHEADYEVWRKLRRHVVQVETRG
jgi:hypothetical protein